jgi:hypothetical protein
MLWSRHPSGSSVPLREFDLAVESVVGWMASRAIPNFAPVSETCKGDRLLQPAVRLDCQRVAEVLLNGDTYISSMMGRAIGLRVWVEGTAQHTAYREMARRLNFVRSQVESIEQEAGDRPSSQRAWFESLRTAAREQDAYVELLRRHGRPVEPPVDWSEEGSN